MPEFNFRWGRSEAYSTPQDPYCLRGLGLLLKGGRGKRRGTMEKGDEGKKERKERKRTEEKVGKGS